MKDTLKKITGILHCEKRDVDGSLLESWTVKNTITNTGKAQLNLLGFQAGTAFTYLAVGSSNTAPAATQTALGTEISLNGFARHVATTIAQSTTATTNDTTTLSYTWTATGSQTVEECGFFNASSVGVMGGRALTTSKSFVTGQSLVINYSIIFA